MTDLLRLETTFEIKPSCLPRAHKPSTKLYLGLSTTRSTVTPASCMPTPQGQREETKANPAPSKPSLSSSTPCHAVLPKPWFMQLRRAVSCPNSCMMDFCNLFKKSINPQQSFLMPTASKKLLHCADPPNFKITANCCCSYSSAPKAEAL